MSNITKQKNPEDLKPPKTQPGKCEHGLKPQPKTQPGKCEVRQEGISNNKKKISK